MKAFLSLFFKPAFFRLLKDVILGFIVGTIWNTKNQGLNNYPHQNGYAF